MREEREIETERGGGEGVSHFCEGERVKRTREALEDIVYLPI